MIKVKSGTNTTTEITKIYVKSGASATKSIAEAYQVYNNGGVKSLKKVFGFSTAACAHNYTTTDSYYGDCQEECWVKYTCTKCGTSYTENTGRGEHSYEQTKHIYPDWCTEEEYYEYTCSICGDSYTEHTGVHGEHDAAGSVDGYCGQCGILLCDAWGHDYRETSRFDAEWCIEETYINYKCTTCGDEYTEYTGEHGIHGAIINGRCEYCDESFDSSDICPQCGTERNPDGLCPNCDTCLVEGTLITMADGTQKLIEEVKSGDLIKSYNPDTNSICEAVVVNNYCTGNDTEYVSYNLSNGNNLVIYGDEGYYDTRAKRVKNIKYYDSTNKALDIDNNSIKIISHDTVNFDVPKQHYHLLSSNNLYYANDILMGHTPHLKFRQLHKDIKELPNSLQSILHHDEVMYRRFSAYVNTLKADNLLDRASYLKLFRKAKTEMFQNCCKYDNDRFELIKYEYTKQKQL